MIFLNINRNEFVTALSFALDFLEFGLRRSVTNHGKRVALLAVYIGEELALDQPDLFDLYACSMLHDNGVTHKVYNALSEDGLRQLESAVSHCVTGESNLSRFPFMKKRDNVILYHHEAYDGSGFFKKQGAEIPLFSQIIAAADTAEILYSGGADVYDITKAVREDSGKRFDPDIAQALERTIRVPAHWLSLNDIFIAGEIGKIVPVFDEKVSLDEVIAISDIMSRIIDSKSPFTGMHSKGLAEKTAHMADFYGLDHEHKKKLIIAADMHDVGKLAIPNSIIDKPGRLTPEEFSVIQSHPYYTRKVFEAVRGLEDVCEWSSNHHEKLNGKGYPYARSKETLSFESQLLACLDIYQALTEKRPYRDEMEPRKAASIMEEMVQNGEISAMITADVLREWQPR